MKVFEIGIILTLLALLFFTLIGVKMDSVAMEKCQKNDFSYQTCLTIIHK